MIEFIKAKSGFAAELKNLRGKRFDLNPGAAVTVLFGPNGCGKTTLLKLAAGHTGIDTTSRNMGGGWNRYPRLIWRDKIQFPDCFSECTIGKCEAEIGWDGSPVLYNSALLSEAGTGLSSFVSDEHDSPDGLMDFQEQVSLTMGHYSEGELRNHKIFKVVEAVKKPPKLEEPRDRAGEAEVKYVEYVKSLGRNGPMTLLWDEPDRSLSIDAQITFWSRFVMGLAQQENVQIVVSSHSLVLLHMPNCFKNFRIIDVEEGYLDKSKRLLEEMSSIARMIEAKAKEVKPPEKEPADGPTTRKAKVQRNTGQGEVPRARPRKRKKG